MTLQALRGAVGACWLVFVVVWILGALSTKRTVERPPNQLLYRGLLVIAFIVLINGRPGPNRVSPLKDAVLPATPPLALLGLALTVAGLALAVWARTTLGTNWSGAVTFKENHTLVQTGPYAAVRHPIYTAILLMFLGSTIAYGTLGAVIGFPLAVLSCVIKAEQEEILLESHFPEEYPAYRRRTRKLVPGVF